VYHNYLKLLTIGCILTSFVLLVKRKRVWYNPSMDTPKLKYRNITVSGGVATGTSTLARNLAETLGWARINAGDIQRETRDNNFQSF
jgi:hypothetical protein